jgi:hypothetical protein
MKKLTADDLCVPIEQRTIFDKMVHSIAAGVLLVGLAEQIGSDSQPAPRTRPGRLYRLRSCRNTPSPICHLASCLACTSSRADGGIMGSRNRNETCRRAWIGENVEDQGNTVKTRVSGVFSLSAPLPVLSRFCLKRVSMKPAETGSSLVDQMPMHPAHSGNSEVNRHRATAHGRRRGHRTAMGKSGVGKDMKRTTGNETCHPVGWVGVGSGSFVSRCRATCPPLSGGSRSGKKSRQNAT